MNRAEIPLTSYFFIFLSFFMQLSHNEYALASDCRKYYGKGYCVDYIYRQTGNRQQGNASKWTGNIDDIKYIATGDVVIFPNAARGTGHVAYVEKVSDKTIQIGEWNHSDKFNKPDSDPECWKTDMFGQYDSRSIEKNDVLRIWRPYMLSENSLGDISFGVSLSVARQNKRLSIRKSNDRGGNNNCFYISIDQYPDIDFKVVSDVIVRCEIKKLAVTRFGIIKKGMPISKLKTMVPNISINSVYNELGGIVQNEYVIKTEDNKYAIKFIEWEVGRHGESVIYSGKIDYIIAGLVNNLYVDEGCL
ncbi:MAG: CHAP domain-containing protein [Chlorobiaceae bacterium]|nr:CHAP domain-containing protein [Chlorobiaceae bacterium]